MSWALDSSPLAMGLWYTASNMKARRRAMALPQASDWQILSFPWLARITSPTRVLIRPLWSKPSTWEISRGMSRG